MTAASAMAAGWPRCGADSVQIFTVRIPIGATGAVGTLRQRGSAITVARDSAGQYTFGNIPVGAEMSILVDLLSAADLTVKPTAKDAAAGTATIVCRTGVTATDPASGNELAVTFIVESLA